MEIFHNDEDGYAAWHDVHADGFVLNHFGGNNPAYNVLHRSRCSFLAREKDEGARTVVEKWCASNEQELAAEADRRLGPNMWNRCGVCFRLHPTPPSESAR